MAAAFDNLSNEQLVIATIPTVTVMLAVITRARAFLTSIPVAEMDFAITPVMGG
jgi:hypothetical protein